ncbi:MAG: pyridoxal phosphate-dependent aminotransferase [Candidatus Hadarchaeum sp.]|uniref:pyridoxal phosphate-dependent aminotransferase n=1 Tax=Candidatus Hadarchaeum sp. TaxID=2883567 RepID=UPI003170E469
MKAAKRMDSIPPSSTLKVLALAKELERSGRRIIHMEVGEPDFDTPAHIKEAAKQALDRGMTKYTPSAGIPELREAIAEHFVKQGINVAAKNVIVTPGAKHAIFCALAAALDPGDEVLIPSPCWTYEAMVKIVGGKPVFIQGSAKNGFKLEEEKLKKSLTPKSRLLLLNYPNNPTGAVMSATDLKPILDIAVDHDLWILSDDIYNVLVYEGEQGNPLKFPGMAERTISINGFSKAYAMTGWRIGYAVAPADFIVEMAKIQEASTSCTASFVQVAAITALKGPQDFVAEMRAEYRRRRDVLVEGLNEIDGIDCLKPQGAFYVFPNIEKLGMSSFEFCELLLKSKGVAAVPGSGFGPGGEGHVRLSYATSMENIKLAIELIKEFVEEIPAHR